MWCLLKEKKSSNTSPHPRFLPLFICVCFINLGESSVDHFGSLVACSNLEWLNCFCNLMGKRKHFEHWVIPISLLCNSQFSCVKGQVSIKSHLTRLHQYCPKHWDFPLFLAFKIRKFSWVSILLFLLACDLPHWFVLFHSSMITAALATFSGGSWEVRIRRKRNRKGREKTKQKQNLHLAKSGS